MAEQVLKRHELGANRQQRVWQSIVKEAKSATVREPDMASLFHSTVLNHSSFRDSISFFLSSILADTNVPSMTIQSIFHQALLSEPMIIDQMLDDLLAHYNRDPACNETIIPLLYFKGYHAIQSYRIAHWLWLQGRHQLALYLRHLMHEHFDVDIHPAAVLGSGIMLDHATGLVVGETAVIGDDVSILHDVTLGGSGNQNGKRHPRVGSGVLISAGAKLLGNITVGDCAKIGAGSVVLVDVPAHSTVAGVPARIVSKSRNKVPAMEMDQSLGGKSRE